MKYEKYIGKTIVEFSCDGSSWYYIEDKNIEKEVWFKPFKDIKVKQLNDIVKKNGFKKGANIIICTPITKEMLTSDHQRKAFRKILQKINGTDVI